MKAKRRDMTKKAFEAACFRRHFVKIQEDVWFVYRRQIAVIRHCETRRLKLVYLINSHDRFKRDDFNGDKDLRAMSDVLGGRLR